MKRPIAMIALAGALALPLLAPGAASASCQNRRLTGTVIGGIGGALIGNSIARGGGGAVIGGLGGAVVGHEVAGAGCGRYRRDAYYRDRPRYRTAYRSNTYADRPRSAASGVRRVYYDQFGNPVQMGPDTQYAGYTQTGYGQAYRSQCRTQMQSYYDDRGNLVQQPQTICGR